MRRSGGSVGGGWRRGGSVASSAAELVAISATARSNASSVAALVEVIPLIFRTNWRAAASTSVGVAGGSSPRRVVMFRHMAEAYGARPAHLVGGAMSHWIDVVADVRSMRIDPTPTSASSVRCGSRRAEAVVAPRGSGVKSPPETSR